MKFDIIIGNPPYQAPCGYKTPSQYSCVDGKHGRKKLYYFFTKLSVELLAEDGICMFVQPPNWRASIDGTALRLWIREHNVVYEGSGVNVGGAFKDVMTAADIQTFRRGGTTDPRWHGRNAIFTENDWQRAWIDAAESNPQNLLNARRGGYKEDFSLPLTTVYKTYKRGIITAQQHVAPLGGDKVIIYPGAFTPWRKNLQKAEIVEAAPFGEKFIGIPVNCANADAVLKWIQSETFYHSQTWLLQPAYHITEEAFNAYVREKYEAGKLIIFPEFLAPHRKNFQKAEIVDAAPFSDSFIGIEATNNAESIMSWIQSKPFHKAMSWLNGSSHGGSLCQYFITEDAYNKYVREKYEV